MNRYWMNMNYCIAFACICAAWLPNGARGQQADESASKAPALEVKIADVPVAIDSALHVSGQLCKRCTVTFEDSTLTEVAAWIQAESGLQVILDRGSLEGADLLVSEPIRESLNEQPIFLLLDRLTQIGIAWHEKQGVIYMQAEDDAVYATQQFNVGDLIDLGYSSDAILDTIQQAVDPDSWEQVGGEGSVVALGDVLFVRQTFAARRRIAGLLQALKSPTRRLFVFDSPANAGLRKRLDQRVTLELVGIPLNRALRTISERAEVPVRMHFGLRHGAQLRDRHPIDLTLVDQPLRIALDVLRQEYGLNWVVRDGVVLMHEPQLRTAVFDVRDLCQSKDESQALMHAIESQAAVVDWEDSGGLGTITFPKDGVMVVYQTERVLDEVLELLGNYRVALRVSKPRDNEEEQNPVEVHYYRMPTAVAMELEFQLPRLLESEDWSNEANPARLGSIVRINSWPGADGQGKFAKDGQDLGYSVPYSVLVIRQRADVHREIPKLLQKIQYGEQFFSDAAGMQGGMGGMGGGFGGGFFRVKASDR